MILVDISVIIKAKKRIAIGNIVFELSQKIDCDI